MDRISDSGSDGCGSIPHGGTKLSINALASFGTLFLCFFALKLHVFHAFYVCLCRLCLTIV